MGITHQLEASGTPGLDTCQTPQQTAEMGNVNVGKYTFGILPDAWNGGANGQALTSDAITFLADWADEIFCRVGLRRKRRREGFFRWAVKIRLEKSRSKAA